MVILLATFSTNAQRYVEREITIPWARALRGGLDAPLLYADFLGKHPLVVITQGFRVPEIRF